VIDDEIHHHAQAIRSGRGDELLNWRVAGHGRCAEEQIVEAIGILDGVEAAGKPGIMDRIHVQPVETHVGDAGKVVAPRFDRSDQGREQVVDAGTAVRWRSLGGKHDGKSRTAANPKG
jgi:hypothetical protein